MPKGKQAKGSRRAPLTEFEREAARQLKARWQTMPGGARLTQEKMAELWGEGGSQSLISQYLNGAIPLNVTAAIRFAGILHCKPHEILDVPELHGRAPLASDNVVQINKAWPLQGVDPDAFRNLPEGEKREIIGIIKEKINQAEKANLRKKNLRG